MGKGLKRDIWVLAGCWATVLTASTLITSASPLAAVSIGINRSVAPFTIGSFWEKRLVDVCVSVILRRMPDLFWLGLREGSWVFAWYRD